MVPGVYTLYTLSGVKGIKIAQTHCSIVAHKAELLDTFTA
jgi:hypothetical protein